MMRWSVDEFTDKLQIEINQIFQKKIKKNPTWKDNFLIFFILPVHQEHLIRKKIELFEYTISINSNLVPY